MLDNPKGLVMGFSALKGTDCFVAPGISGCYGGISHEQVVKNRANYFSQFGISLDDTVWMHQDHENHRLTIDDSHRGQGARTRDNVPRGDMMMTDTSGLTLVVRKADCLGMVVHSPCGRAVMVIHAGTKGLVSNHVQLSVGSFVYTYGKKYGFTASDLVVYVGPFLATKNYEFNPNADDKVGQQILNSFYAWESVEEIDGIPHLNMGRLVMKQFGLVGVRSPHVSFVDTYADNTLWSYRQALHEKGSGAHRDDNIGFIQCM